VTVEMGLWKTPTATLISMAILLTGCSLALPTGGSETPADTTSQATLTPLQIRDKLNNLDIFSACYDPISRESDFGFAITEVNCFIIDQDEAPNLSEAKRGITAWILPGTWPDFETDFCLWRLNGGKEHDEMRLITDTNTFAVFGRPGGDIGAWPQEVWPEDVQRVLGGELVTLGDWCDRRYVD